MENAKKYLTIRKFSELTHTSIDTLKHYDAIGLLKPAYIGKIIIVITCPNSRWYSHAFCLERTHAFRSKKSENLFGQSTMK